MFSSTYMIMLRTFSSVNSSLAFEAHHYTWIIKINIRKDSLGKSYRGFMYATDISNIVTRQNIYWIGL